MPNRILINVILLFLLIAGSAGIRILLNYFLSLKGWKPLSLRFTSPEEPLGQALGLVSLGIGGALYKNSVVMIYNDQGMYLRMIFFLKMFHPPLFIPWNKFSYVRDLTKFGIIRHELNVAQTNLIINNRIYSEIESYIPVQ